MKEKKKDKTQTVMAVYVLKGRDEWKNVDCQLWIKQLAEGGKRVRFMPGWDDRYVIS